MLLSAEARGSCHGARLATAGPRAWPESGGSGWKVATPAEGEREARHCYGKRSEDEDGLCAWTSAWWWNTPWTTPVGCVAGVSLLILPCGPQVWLSNPSLRRSGNPTRLLLSDWSRATSAPPPLMKTTTASMMETTRKEREGRSWRPPSPPTPTRQVSSQALPWQHHCEDQLVKLIVLPVFLPGVQMFEDSKVSLIWSCADVVVFPLTPCVCVCVCV